MSAPAMGIEQFAKLRGLTSPADLSGIIHAGCRGTPEAGAARTRYRRAIDEAGARVDETRRLYREAIERGEISLPAKQTASEIAAGNPDLPSTQAAQRLLAKHLEIKRRAALAGQQQAAPATPMTKADEAREANIRG